MIRRRPFLLLLPVVGALVALAACGDDDSSGGGPTGTLAPTQNPDAANAEAVVQAFADAWNAGDVEGVLLRFDDEGLKSVFRDDTITRDAVRENAAALLVPQFDITDFPNTVVNGDSASVEVTGGNIEPSTTYLLVREGEDWRITGREVPASPSPTPAPS